MGRLACLVVCFSVGCEVIGRDCSTENPCPEGYKCGTDNKCREPFIEETPCNIEALCPEAYQCGSNGLCKKEQIAALDTLGFELRVKDKADVLFVIDDSNSMEPKQDELKAKLPQLLNVFAGKNADYHFGVISTDLGAKGIVTCPIPGKAAKLVAKGTAAPVNCQAPVGKDYVEYNSIGNTNNLPQGQDLATTLGCMLALGDNGCGYEMPLEAAYRAVHDVIPKDAKNAGFLRADAVLTIVFLTDEDDCSGDENSNFWEVGTTAMYGPQTSFRCTRYGIKCAGQQFSLSPMGPYAFSECEPLSQAEGGKLHDIDKYVNFFTRSKLEGGIKLDRRDVVLAAITATGPLPVSSVLESSTHQPCSMIAANPGTCSIYLTPSCVAQNDSTFRADPAVRLNRVLTSAFTSTVVSICDGDYASVLSGLVSRLSSSLPKDNFCLRQPVKGASSCTVTQAFDNMSNETVIPACSENNNAVPCFRLEDPNNACPKMVNPGTLQCEHYGVVVDRGGVASPEGSYLKINCQAYSGSASSC